MKEYATGPSTLSAQSNTMLAPRPQTPVDVVRETLTVARELASQVNGMVDRLAGSQPEDANSGVSRGGCGGLFDDMQIDAEITARTLHGALRELDRLRSILP